MTLIGLLVFVLICCLVFWVVRTLASAFGLPAPIVAVVNVLLVVVAVLYLLSAFGLFSSGPVIRLR